MITRFANVLAPTRRQMFSLAAVGTAGVGGLIATLPLPARAAPASLPRGCMKVMADDIEGPYYFDAKLHRADITEGLAGIPLHVHLRLLGTDCLPMVGARVDMWHSDNQGIYSGYTNQGDTLPPIDARGKTYLRGIQMTDAQGDVTFTTIYPGWYRGRTPHVHAKIFPHDKAVLNVQMYFPDALNEAVYTMASDYHRTVPRDTLNVNDHFVLPDRSGFLDIKEAAHRYEASLTIAVDAARPMKPFVRPADMKFKPRMDATPPLPAEAHARALFPPTV